MWMRKPFEHMILLENIEKPAWMLAPVMDYSFILSANINILDIIQENKIL